MKEHGCSKFITTRVKFWALSWRLFSLAAALPGVASASPNFHVVIDPGHGGADTGAIFQSGVSKIFEKELTLLISKTIARELQTRGIQTTLTRTEDKDISLPHRTKFANQLKADLFISVHMNWVGTSGQSGIQGVETYILNNTSDESSKRLAHLENKSGGVVSDDSVPTEVGLILKDLRLDANLAESKYAACLVQYHLVDVNPPESKKSRNRGIRQALFYVLLGADMPSLLVEVGFLSSPRDRQLLLSEIGRRKIGAAVATAVQKYKRFRGTPTAASLLSRCQVR